MKCGASTGPARTDLEAGVARAEQRTDDRINCASKIIEWPVGRAVKRRYVVGDRGIGEPPYQHSTGNARSAAQHKTDELYQLG